VSALNALLFREEGFRGNSDDYYDPRNSFLNEVLDRRTGIPLTLSAVYIEVARRAGVEVHGVGLPGHFVVRAPGPGHGVLLDPFHGGARLSLEDCRKRLERIYARRVPIEPRMLEACGPRAMVLRMLRNLKAIYARREDHLRLLRVHDLLLRLTPGDPEELRERGLLHASIDCYDLAARDLEASLGHGRDAPEAALVRAQIEDLRRRAARLN
jgi:regulator of sirC expression with transglutaminase-like and TPR domain